MDFDASELQWLTEIIRSQKEAVQQLEELPPEMRGALTAELARRQLVLGSSGFGELLEMMAAHGNDVARYREHRDTMSPEALSSLEAVIAARLAVLQNKITSIRFLLDSI